MRRKRVNSLRILLLISMLIVPQLTQTQHSVAYFESKDARWAAELVKSE
jgi:hypothetical protein